MGGHQPSWPAKVAPPLGIRVVSGNPIYFGGNRLNLENIAMGRRKGKKDEDEEDEEDESMDAREREKSEKDKKRPEVLLRSVR